MRKWWHSIFVKFSVAFIVVGIIPLFALSVFSLQTFTNHVQKYTVNNLQQMVLYMGYNLNNQFNQYNGISKLMYFGTNEYSNIGTNQSISVNEQERVNQMPIDDFLKTVVYSDPYIRNAYFIRTMDTKLYFQTRDNKTFYPDKLPIADWQTRLAGDPRQLAVIPTHPENYFAGTGRSVITFGRNLIDTSGANLKEVKVVGVLFFDVDVKLFDDLFRELSLGKKDELYVLDGDNRVYYGNRDAIGTTVNVPYASNGGKIVLGEDVPFLNGRIVTLIDKGDLFKQLIPIRSAVWIAILVGFAVIVAMGAWFSRRLGSPIRNVIKQMVRVESGNLDVQVERAGQDEIGRLAHGFNRMVERLNTFINEAYVAEIKQKQAELSALKSQIRPHYLYNTLEVIRMNAVHNDDNEVADMILSLSNQLKYVIDYGEDWVSLRRELAHLRNYFSIIQVRYENRIELRCEMDDEVGLDWGILKLSLQPIVENAVQHGILPKGGKGTILVRIERKEDDLAVTIYDDGAGMDEDELATLRSRIFSEGTPSGSVGLKNVHDRIRSECGKPYGMEIGSRKHVGTSVRLLLPVRKEESGE